MKGSIAHIKSTVDVQIKILKIGWINICQKHPELKENFNLLVDCLKNGDEVWSSKQNSNVCMYYKKINKKFICAVCKHYNGDGFLITAYFTYKLQGKEKIWQK